MNISFSTINLVPRPHVNISKKCLHSIDEFTFREFEKNKVVVVLGATGTGKSRLSIDLASHFGGEVTDDEHRNVPHHLLGFLDPLDEFTALDFTHHASLAIKGISGKGNLPIIAGGSNSYVNALVVQNSEFRVMDECCFLWVQMPILHSVVSKRVDRMVKAGLVNEGREFFDPKRDYFRGILRSIGVSEMHDYYMNETTVDEYTKNKLLESAINEIKENTCSLTIRQVHNILKLEKLLIWKVHRLNATAVHVKCGKEASKAYESLVFGPSTKIVERFLNGSVDFCLGLKVMCYDLHMRQKNIVHFYVGE